MEKPAGGGLRRRVRTKLLPRAPMRITMITIGSRGDVQPFISLCKGFISDGHTCTIATNLEFQPWIKGFGISFKELKGSFAELYTNLTQYAIMC